MADSRLLWVDVETTGLEDDDVILEIGLRITDMWGNDRASNTWLVGETSDRWARAIERGLKHEIVGSMHDKSGLWKDWNEAITSEPAALRPDYVTDQIISWLLSYDVEKFTLPMCGSSVHSDRKWMARDLPEVEEFFHYRNIDVSTVKELCRRFSPPIFSRVDEYVPVTSGHRPQEDLDMTIAEFKFYVDNFLWVADEVH